MSQLREKITSEERRRKIIEYIRIHPGCKMDEVVSGVSNIVSRVVVFRIISELVKEGVVENKARNRRDSSLYLKEDNLLLKLQQELDQFEKAYLNLLDKSKERIDKKDFTTIAKIIVLSSPEPKKWNDEDRLKFHKYEQDNILDYIINSNEFIELNKEIKEYHSKKEIQKLLNNINSYLKPSKNLSVIQKMDLANLRGNLLEFWKNTMKLKQYYSKLDYEEWAKDFEFNVIIITLTQLFFLLSDILFYRLTFIWSNNIQDKDLLHQLSILVFDKISKINSKLSEYINSVDHLLPKHEYITQIINNRFESQSWSIRMSRYFYRGLKMEKYIDEVIASITVLDKELTKYRSVSLYSTPKIFKADDYPYFIENLNMRYIDDYYYFKKNTYIDPEYGYVEPDGDESDIGDYSYQIIENPNIPTIIQDLQEKENFFELNIEIIDKL